MTPTRAQRGLPGEIEVSVVIPCLNESETIGQCVSEAIQSLAVVGVIGEVIVADNGSDDRSASIAETLGARVVRVGAVGYGNASLAGIAAARGKFVITGDADGSHDFGEMDRLLEKVRDCDLVIGNRFQGGIEPGAMPWLHRYIGTPAISILGRILCGTAVGDLNCGFRGLRVARVCELGLTATGMEFASELVVKATQSGLRVCEVPVSMSRSRRSRAPHLNSFKDGWRHLRLLFAHRTWRRSARARAAIAAAASDHSKA